MRAFFDRIARAIHWARPSKTPCAADDFDAAVWRTRSACDRVNKACSQVEEFVKKAKLS